MVKVGERMSGPKEILAYRTAETALDFYLGHGLFTDLKDLKNVYIMTSAVLYITMYQ